MLKSVRSYALRPTTSSMPRRRSTTDGLVKNGAITPSVWVRPSDRLRAVALGRYPSSSITARTRTRVASATPAESLSTRETVPMPTPARSATSRIRGARGPGRSGALATTRTGTPAHGG